MAVHTVFDLLAWASASLIAFWIGTRHWLDKAGPRRTPFSDPAYFIALSLGAVVGAVLFGSLNLDFAGVFVLGHSIAGALVGGIGAVEIYKWRAGITGSTGVGFVAPLAAGIAVGRIGCFLAGLPDYTYGTQTALPWGVDFGDGIRRHPVQLYEAAAMAAFLAVYLSALARRSVLFLRDGFYLLVVWYAAQRFLWEFLKPYPKLVGPFNLFHLTCAALAAYGLMMLGRKNELRSAV